MKITLLLFVLTALVSACGKHRYCADCVERGSGYRADVYCAQKGAVDTYVDGLENSSFQDWDCTVTKE